MEKVRLAITDAELLAEGVPMSRVAQVRGLLQQAVNKEPSLNAWPTLAAMARSLAWTVERDWAFGAKGRSVL